MTILQLPTPVFSPACNGQESAHSLPLRGQQRMGTWALEQDPWSRTRPMLRWVLVHALVVANAIHFTAWAMSAIPLFPSTSKPFTNGPFVFSRTDPSRTNTVPGFATASIEFMTTGSGYAVQAQPIRTTPAPDMTSASPVRNTALKPPNTPFGSTRGVVRSVGSATMCGNTPARARWHRGATCRPAQPCARGPPRNPVSPGSGGRGQARIPIRRACSGAVENEASPHIPHESTHRYLQT